jgi:PIN domain nuclease of toxin-antitoxin system
MNNGLLLDSHTLLWLDMKMPMHLKVEFEIAEAAAQGRLFLSDISIWELGLAGHKKNLERRPDLRGLSFAVWMKETVEAVGVDGVRISEAIAHEAAEVPSVYGSGDPGDCFLIATARLQNLVLVTRDAKIIRLAARLPDYLTVIAC